MDVFMARLHHSIKRDFPLLKHEPYEVNIWVPNRQNCVGDALGKIVRIYAKHIGANVDDLIRMFEDLGWTKCKNGNLENDFVKVVIYKNSCDRWTHVARQTKENKWRHKCNRAELIITDSARSLEGVIYGKVHCYMKRPRTSEDE